MSERRQSLVNLKAVAKGCANTGVTVMGTARILRGRKWNMTGNLALPLTQRSECWEEEGNGASSGLPQPLRVQSQGLPMSTRSILPIVDPRQ